VLDVRLSDPGLSRYWVVWLSRVQIAIVDLSKL
jgi:hypothetical protein